MASVDLNADLGESFGAWQLGDDDAMLGLVTSANVACGFHAGDPAALRHSCAGGRRAGRPDRCAGRLPRPRRVRKALHRRHAGRSDRRRDLPDRRAAGARARGRGHRSATSNPMARCTTRSSTTTTRPAPSPRRYTPSTRTSPCSGWPDRCSSPRRERLGLRTVPEAFADRSYRPDGQLVSRRERNAVLHDPAEIADRVASMVQSGRVVAVDGSTIADHRRIRLRTR